MKWQTFLLFLYVAMRLTYPFQYLFIKFTRDSTAGRRKIRFIKPVCCSTVSDDQTTVFENFCKYNENQIKSVPISLFQYAPV